MVRDLSHFASAGAFKPITPAQRRRLLSFSCRTMKSILMIQVISLHSSLLYMHLEVLVSHIPCPKVLRGTTVNVRKDRSKRHPTF